MPFEYKVDTVVSERDLEETINHWAQKGYEPHTVSSILKKSLLGDAPILTLVLVVRKVIRRSRKGTTK